MIDLLMTACVEALRSRLGLPQDECGVQDLGAPPVACGPLYVAVHEGAASRSPTSDEALCVTVELHMTISAMHGEKPRDWPLQRVAGGNPSRLAWSAIRCLHNHREAIRVRANELANSPSPQTGPFVKPLEFESMTAPSARPHAWWGREGEGYGGSVVMLSFGQAEAMYDSVDELEGLL